tara:strand:+ start:35 stop:625 length:591 start_codon:yes stop_codon:yes gene_type:complete
MDNLKDNIFRRFDITSCLIFILIFIFVRYGIDNINILFYILISIGGVYLYQQKKHTIEKKKYKNPVKYSNKKEADRIVVDSSFDNYIELIKKFDNNNIIYLIKKNIRNLYENMNVSNADMLYQNNNIDNLFFLRDRIIGYMESLNISFDDSIIDEVKDNIINKLDIDIENFKKRLNHKIYSGFFSKIEGYSKNKYI